jgi:hypothetical protein
VSGGAIFRFGTEEARVRTEARIDLYLRRLARNSTAGAVLDVIDQAASTFEAERVAHEALLATFARDTDGTIVRPGLGSPPNLTGAQPIGYNSNTRRPGEPHHRKRPSPRRSESPKGRFAFVKA